ncbi:MAG TPA: CinA family nicotinamide mononucleotide deamidase-related protein [Saprospiraceae bacterium]|nr:CinA family nicotinamide mononucleotide deamidase-related protein [Saprospiraceae bacterium]
MNIALVIIGDEVLLGQVIDTNSASIARMLYESGMQVNKKWTVADQHEEILAALKEASGQADLILITGGLGPTKDDITKKALAEFFKVPLVFSEENKLHIEAMLKERNIRLSDRHFEQCYLPQNAQLLDNRMGTALGLWMEDRGKIFVSMPGVPYEMEYIMQQDVLPRLKSNHKTVAGVYHETILTVGMGETEIADIIEPALGEFPEYLSLAYLPSQGQVRLRITGKHGDMDFLSAKVSSYVDQITNLLPEHIIGYGSTSLENEIGKWLRARGKSLSTAESCTGGFISHKLTSIPGASDFFKGGIISYHNDIKETHLGVPAEVLAEHGAVSEACVRHMVLGACETLQTDFAIAASGVAGPGGGTPEKPVGTVWIAYGSKSEVRTRKFRFYRDRLRNIEATSTNALVLFWKYLKTLS